MVPVTQIEWGDDGLLEMIWWDNGPRHGRWGDAPTVTIMQFTGLHDRDGKEIWEGDIVTRREDTGLVEWREEPHFDLSLRSFGEWHIRSLQGEEFHDHMGATFVGSDLTVIGNRFANPELLGEK